MVARAKQRVEGLRLDDGSNELEIERISRLNETLRRGEPVDLHCRPRASDARIDCGGRERAHDIPKAPGTEFDQMLGERVATGKVIDSHDIKLTAVRKR